MPLQIGLRPIQEDGPAPERLRPTPSLGEMNLRATSLAPTAAPSRPMVQGPAVMKDDNASRLADALSSLNPALTRFSQTFVQEQKEDVETRVQSRLMKAGSTGEAERMAQTDPEMASGLGKAAASRRLGLMFGSEAVQNLKSAYETDFDRANGNVRELTAKVAAPYLDRFKDDPVFLKHFNESTEAGFAAVTNADSTSKTKDAVARTNEDQSKIFLGIAQAGIDAGKPVAEVAQKLTGEFYGNERILKLPKTDQQKALLPVVSALAEQGRYDLVKAIGEVTHEGSRLVDNPTVGPSIAQAMTHARSVRDRDTKDATVGQRQTDYSLFHDGKATPEDEARLLEAARKRDGTIDEGTANSWVQTNRTVREAQQEKARKEAEQTTLLDKLNGQEARLDSTAVEAMKQGRLYSLPQVTILNKKGAEETLTPDQYRDRAGPAYEKWSQAYAQQTKEPWDKQVLREAEVFTQNGYVPKKWKDVIAAGGNSISAAVTMGGELPEAAKQGYALYKLLRANNAQMLRDLVPRDQRDLYETWRIGEEEAGIDPKKALEFANKLSSDPAAKRTYEGSITAQAIRDKVGSLGSGMFGQWFGGTPAPENVGDVQVKMKELADFYGLRGLGPDKAMEEAAKQVRSSHISVNGYWVDASDRRLPPNFGELAGDLLTQYAEKHGKAEGLDASDLTIRAAANGTGVWRIVHRGSGVSVDDRTDGIFRTNDLLRAQATRQDKDDKAGVAKLKRNAKADPYVPMEQVGP